MKALVSSMIILGLISAAPAFAEKPDGAGQGQKMEQKGQMHQAQAGQGEMQQKKMQEKAQGGQGEMNQERHRNLEKKQVGQDTGKGSAQGKSEGSEQGKKWWKFWGD